MLRAAALPPPLEDGFSINPFRNFFFFSHVENRILFQDIGQQSWPLKAAISSLAVLTTGCIHC